ncbi:MAG: PRC-barrel domain-containing protein [Pacificimonas sp.]
MDIWTQIENDHTSIKAAGQDVLKAVAGEGPAGRDNQFDVFDTMCRRHLAAVEDVVFPPLEKEGAVSANVHEVMQHHKSLRRDLSALDRSGKQDQTWTREFEVVLAQLDKLCGRHEKLIEKARPLVNAKDGKSLGEKYTEAKLKRTPNMDWKKVGIGAGAAIGVAAVAGAVAAGVKHKRAAEEKGEDPVWKRRRKNDEDEFELSLRTDETLRLISSSKVEGTTVVDRDEQKIGKIMSFMVDKYTGRVAYAVLQFGGVMGIGSHYFPLPWKLLDYDVDADAYRLNIDRDLLETAPKFEKDDSPEFDKTYRAALLAYYRPA